MDLIALTRQLVHIESTTGKEAVVGDFLYEHLTALGYQTRRMPVEPGRFNVFAVPPEHSNPVVVLSTHMDTVPPYVPPRVEGNKLFGRGACDAKGIIAAQIEAAERLRKDNIAVGLLFVVGEERDSLGAMVANQQAPGSRFLINGEPTENRLAIASKGALRVEVTARGKLAHSAYPELGESAIEKLLDALERLRAMKLPKDREIGPCTMNIGVIEGGQAPNVIADRAKAHLLYRLVGPSAPLKKKIIAAVGRLAKVEFVLEIPFQRFRRIEGLKTMVAAFTTDVPKLSKWGEPVLLGPGSIHVAHTEHEFITKKDLEDAVELYVRIAQNLSS